jgi:hypothetical protein
VGEIQCPECGCIFEPPNQDSVLSLDDLKKWLKERGLPTLPGDRVNRSVACAILDRKPGTIKNWTTLGVLDPVRVRGRSTFRLDSLLSILNSVPNSNER